MSKKYLYCKLNMFTLNQKLAIVEVDDEGKMGDSYTLSLNPMEMIPQDIITHSQRYDITDVVMDGADQIVDKMIEDTQKIATTQFGRSNINFIKAE